MVSMLTTTLPRFPNAITPSITHTFVLVLAYKVTAYHYDDRAWLPLLLTASAVIAEWKVWFISDALIFISSAIGRQTYDH